MKPERRSGGAPLLWMAMLAAVLLLSRACHSPQVTTADGDVVDLRSLRPQSPGEDFAAPPETRRILLEDGTRLDERQVAQYLAAQPALERWATYSWNYGGRVVTSVAPGLDQRLHFANGFLVGYVPYPDVAPWVPLYALARNKAYQLDHDSLPGAEEVWQTSREAFFYPTGDCEDHAIALADWLIGLGLDARVVLGSVDGGGHAWVVVFDGARTYLLEATDKRIGSNQALPLADGMTGYRPEQMFNRRDFWVNTGSPMTTDYRGAQWEMRSRYRRGDTTRNEDSAMRRPREKSLGDDEVAEKGVTTPDRTPR